MVQYVPVFMPQPNVTQYAPFATPMTPYQQMAQMTYAPTPMMQPNGMNGIAMMQPGTVFMSNLTLKIRLTI